MIAIGMIFCSSILAGSVQGWQEFKFAMLLPILILVLLGHQWQALHNTPRITDPDFLFASAIGASTSILGLVIGLFLRRVTKHLEEK